MAIDQRQIQDISNLKFDIITDKVEYGENPGLATYREDDSNDIHLVLTLPTKMDPNYVEPEPEPEPEPADTTGAPTKELKAYNIEDIVEFVRAGYGSKFPVGSVIPIPLQTFVIQNSSRDTRTYGGHRVMAVVIGHDHNLEKETPQVKHTMTLALMYRYTNSDSLEDLQPVAWVSPSEFTKKVMDSVDSSILAALPPEWQNAVVKTTKTGSGISSGKVISKTSSIFIPSYYEVYGYQGFIDAQLKETWENGAQLQYEYFKKNKFPEKFNYFIGSTFYSTKGMTVSRSPYHNSYGSAILLESVTGAYRGVLIYGKAATGSNADYINYKSPFMNTIIVSYVTFLKGDLTRADILNNSYDDRYYSNAKCRVALNKKELRIGTDTSDYVSKMGTEYAYTGAGVIPCFNIG